MYNKCSCNKVVNCGYWTHFIFQSLSSDKGSNWSLLSSDNLTPLFSVRSPSESFMNENYCVVCNNCHTLKCSLYQTRSCFFQDKHKTLTSFGKTTITTFLISLGICDHYQTQLHNTLIARGERDQPAYYKIH